MIVLGIESSCDETGIALYSESRGLLAHCLYTQVSTHQIYGGVVPELASRDHITKTLPLIKETLSRASILHNEIAGVAFTLGPGLSGALLVGSMIARSLAYAWKKPAIGVHHMEGHLLAPMLEQNAPTFPFLALLVSGGHTLLVSVKEIGDYEILGESLDDAAGEAFDKTAKLLGLPLPGGPHLAKLASRGEKGKYHFPRPMTDRPSLDFSFSGLKTFALTTINKELKKLSKDERELPEQVKADIACAFEEAVVDTLAIKCLRALKATGLKTLVIAGGVGANLNLRQRLIRDAEKHQFQVFYPRLEFCTDNGAMIAYSGLQRLKRGFVDNLSVKVLPRWPLSEL